VGHIDLAQVDWARAQFALTAMYHWIFVPLTLGLSILVAFFETIYYKTGKEEWKNITRFWMTLFAVNFAIGVATGIIMEFEFGTNWSNYSWMVGDIFGAPLAAEGLFAFFLETTFFAVMFFGSSGFLLAALFVVSVSSWLLLKNRHQEMARKSIAVAAVFGVIAASFVGLTGDESAYTAAQVQPMKLAAMEGLYHGGYNADMVAIGIVNPDKKPGDQQKEFTAVAKVPAVLSILANRKIGSYVPGIDDLIFGNRKQGIVSAAEKIESGKKAIASLATYKTARKKGSDGVASQALESFRKNQQYIGYGYFEKAEDLVPNVPLVFYSFHIMVALGTIFPVIFLLFLLFLYKKNLAKQKWFLWLGCWSVFLGYLAQQSGWVVAEVGRQPWAIQDLLPVFVARSNLTVGTIQTTFFMFLAVFTVLLIAEVSIMLKQIKIGPEGE